MQRRTTTWTLVCLLALAPLAYAGSLEPPGAPAPTMKTLVEVEPRILVNQANTPSGANALFEISQPGSYYLGGNITITTTAVNGISINSDDVTLDLNGFSIIGVGSVDAIRIISGDHVVIRNGFLQGFSNGMLIDGNSNYVTVEDVHSVGHVNAGFTAFGGAHITFRNCRASNNGRAGFRAANTPDYLTYSGCTAHNNGTTGSEGGFWLEGDAHVTDCSSDSNTGPGFRARRGSYLTNVLASNNTTNGIQLDGRASVTDSMIVDNTEYGISATDFVSLTNNRIYTNGSGGIRARSQAQITGNHVTDNGAVTGTGDGINLYGSNGYVDSNTCALNAGNGIDVFSGADNTVTRNILTTDTINAGVTNNVAPTSTNAGTAGAWDNMSN